MGVLSRRVTRRNSSPFGSTLAPFPSRQACDHQAQAGILRGRDRHADWGVLMGVLSRRVTRRNSSPFGSTLAPFPSRSGRSGVSRRHAGGQWGGTVHPLLPCRSGVKRPDRAPLSDESARLISSAACNRDSLWTCCAKRRLGFSVGGGRIYSCRGGRTLGWRR